MLSSVLYARDRWLKPGGAILPDTVTIFIAGFGKGGTSLPFWENVYGFNMCTGKEVVEDAGKAPMVDVVDSKDIVMKSTSLKFLDLVTMSPNDTDFRATCELELKPNLQETTSIEKSRTVWCHGIAPSGLRQDPAKRRLLSRPHLHTTQELTGPKPSSLFKNR